MRPCRQHLLAAHCTNHPTLAAATELAAKTANCPGDTGDASCNIEIVQPPYRHWLVMPRAARLPCLAGDGGHETFLDHHRVLVDDWHLDIAGFAF